MNITLTVSQWELLAPYAESLQRALPEAFPRFGMVALEASADAERMYKGFLLGAPIPGRGALKAPSPATAKGVFRNQTGVLSWALGNASRNAESVEFGREEYDMKKCLATAPRARRAKDGSMYLVIPFRHATSDAKTNAAGRTGTGMRAMPKKVYEAAKGLSRSMRVGTAFTRESATGFTVPAWGYQWQGRISEKTLLAMGLDAATAKRNAGMVRFGKKGHSSYMTFRVMSQKSPASSWIRKKQEPLHALETAISMAREAHAEGLGSAFVADLMDLIQGQGR
jgi:hypothetical protein